MSENLTFDQEIRIAAKSWNNRFGEPLSAPMTTEQTTMVQVADQPDVRQHSSTLGEGTVARVNSATVFEGNTFEGIPDPNTADYFFDPYIDLKDLIPRIPSK